MHYPEILHYTKLKVGEIYLMSDGSRMHLIGHKILGDRSFLFKSFDGEDKLHLNYPGLPGAEPHPIYKMSNIYKEVDIELKDIRSNMINKQVQLVMEQYKDK